MLDNFNKVTHTHMLTYVHIHIIRDIMTVINLDRVYCAENSNTNHRANHFLAICLRLKCRTIAAMRTIGDQTIRTLRNTILKPTSRKVAQIGSDYIQLNFLMVLRGRTLNIRALFAVHTPRITIIKRKKMSREIYLNPVYTWVVCD